MPGKDHHLIWPTKKDEPADDELDLHLVFEYNEGDQILGYTAPRSNRFYFVHDPNGATFKQMDYYHEHHTNWQSVKRHMFGGFQLIQKLGLTEGEARLKQL